MSRHAVRGAADVGTCIVLQVARGWAAGSAPVADVLRELAGRDELARSLALARLLRRATDLRVTATMSSIMV